MIDNQKLTQLMKGKCIMAEYCIDCFIKLHPILQRSDLIIVNERDLCEGCGKEVKQTVFDIKESALKKLQRERSKKK